jgi:hypothetical protein
MRKLWVFALVLSVVLTSCHNSSKTTAVEENPIGINSSSIHDVLAFRVQFTPTLVINAMPMATGDPYLILELKEIDGKNIQPALALDHVVMEFNGKKTKVDITEMQDFGTDSPILQGVVRDIPKDVNKLDRVTLHFFEIVSLKTHELTVQNLNSTVAY